MIRKIHIENFRSIRNENLELGKITVLTGANNSGKSSIMYGLMVLQDFVFNPNQTLEELFALPFVNLGGFEEVKNKITTPGGISGFIRLGVGCPKAGGIYAAIFRLNFSFCASKETVVFSRFHFSISLVGLPSIATRMSSF